MKQISVIILFAAFFFPSRIVSQTYDTDSIKSILPSLTGSDRFKALYILSDRLEGRYPMQAVGYALEAIHLGTKLGKRDTIAELYTTASFASSLLGDFSNALTYSYTALELSTRTGNPKDIASSHSTLGITYVYLGQFSKALEHHHEALRIREKHGLIDDAIRTYNNIGVAYHNMGMYDKAIEYYREVVKRRGTRIDTLALIRFYQNVGFAELKRGNLDTATAYHRIAINLARGKNLESGLAYSYYNLGLINIETKLYNKAVNNLLKSYSIYRDLGQKHGMLQSLNALGTADYRSQQYAKAILHLNEAIELSKQINAKSELVDAYGLLSKIYEANGDPLTAFKYFKLYSSSKDTLFNSKENTKITELSIQYEREVKKHEMEVLQKESENRAIILVSVVALLTVIIVVLFVINRKIRNAKKTITNQHDQLAQLNADLNEKIREVRTLSGLLPICSNCKKIRNDDGYWEKLEGYISEHSEATFSHGICPDCKAAYLSDLSQHLK